LADSLLANKVVAGRAFLFSISLIPFLPLRATETYLAVSLLLLQNHQYVTLAGGWAGAVFIFGNHYFIQATRKPIAFYCH
jgi:hypothetical protein